MPNIDHLAKLSLISLPEDEAARLASDMEHIMRLMDQILDLDLPPLADGEYTPLASLREDTPFSRVDREFSFEIPKLMEG